MRTVPFLACALLLLVGCGKKSDPPPVNLNPGSDANKDKGKNGGSGDKKNGQGGSDKKKEKEGSGTKETATDNLTFDPKDAQKTLTWLIKRADTVRSTPAEDKPGREKAWKIYDDEVKSAEKQKIAWTLKVVEFIEPQRKDDKPGVVLETVKSPAGPAYLGLRLAPSSQPKRGTSFRLLLENETDTTKMQPGATVTVSGTVEKIVPARETAENPGGHEFQVRLLDGYTITPANPK